MKPLDGFFDDEKVEGNTKKRTKSKHTTKKELTQDELCDKCGLYKKGCRTPKMEPHGDFKKEILVWAEAPGEDEDENTGHQLTGASGDYLRKTLEPYDIDLDIDCVKVNSVDCRPPKNRTPTQSEINCCYPRKQRVIDEYKPKTILLLGDAAVDSFYKASADRNFVSLGIASLRGKVVPDELMCAWVCHSYHSSYIIRGNEDKSHVFKNDVMTLVDTIKLQRPRFNSQSAKKKIVFLTEFEELHNTLVTILSMHLPVVFDYETSSYRYYEKIHKLYIVSFATVSLDGKINTDVCVFPYELEDANGKPYWTSKEMKQLHEDWKLIMLNNPLIAQNIKHEMLATKCFFDVWPDNFVWDTMLGSRAMDESYGVNGLKIQAYLNWGVHDYSG